MRSFDSPDGEVYMDAEWAAKELDWTVKDVRKYGHPVGKHPDDRRVTMYRFSQLVEERVQHT